MKSGLQVGGAPPRKHLNVLSGNAYRAFIQQQVTLGVLPAAAPAAQGTANTNWEDELLRTSATINHNLAFAGGSANTSYRASVNYFDQHAIVIANGMRRY